MLRPWRPPVLLPVFPRRHQAAVPARDRPLDRSMAQECCALGGSDLFSVQCSVLGPSSLVPVFPPRHQAAVSARDRPLDRPLARAWFRVPCPRWLRLSCSSALSCSPSAGPTALVTIAPVVALLSFLLLSPFLPLLVTCK